MATRSKRTSSTSTPVPGPERSTPIQGRPSSPLSPTRHSRLQEKAELQHLNDRLAAYIDRVRHLENENARLTVEIQTTHETISRETTNLKSMYEHELSDARKLLDETAREKAKMEIDMKRIWEERDELKERLDKKNKELMIAENSARIYESRCTELSGKYNTASADRKKALDEVKELENENDRLRKQLDEFRKHLEDETLARVDLENTVQSLREELTFKDQIHSQELNETRTRRQVEINEIDGRLVEQYEAKLQQSLQELRDQYEAQMRANREEIEMLYDVKMKNLQNAASRNSSAASGAIEELRITRSKIEGLNSRIGELEATNSALNARVRDLENLLEAERSRHSDDMALLEVELGRLRDEMAQQLQEYQDLMDIKVSLDLEIAAYDKLLKGEEHRLNITQSPTTTAAVKQISQSLRSGRTSVASGRRTPAAQAAARKRKRTMLEESEDRHFAEYYVSGVAKGDIEIAEADTEGRFVKIRNKGKKEINIGGWQLYRTAGNNETTFKFHRSVKIDGGATITIWSSDITANHEPPSNIVMKEQRWFIGDNMKTTLFNNHEEEVASLQHIKQQVSTHASKQRTSGSGGYGLTVDNDNIYHQQVRPESGSPVGGESEDEKCRIM